MNNESDVILSEQGRSPANIYIGKMSFIAAPFKRRHEKHYKGNKIHMIVDAVFLAIILLLIGAIVILNFYHTPRDLGLNISVQGESVIGQNMMVEIDYVNLRHREITDAKLVLTTPKNFIITRVEPAENFDKKTRTIYIGNLSSRGNGVIKIFGRPMGNIGASQSVTCALNYKIKGDDYQELSTVYYNLERSALTAQFEVPSIIYAGAEFDSTVKIVNEGDVDMNDIVLVFDDNFTIKHGDKELKDNELRLDKIQKDSVKNIELAFLARDGQPGLVKHVVEIFQLINGQRFRLFNAEREIDLQKSALNFNIKTQKTVSRVAEKVIYEVEYVNTANEPINNLQIGFSSANTSYSVSELRYQKNNLFDTKAGMAVVGSVQPKTVGKFTLSVSYDRNKIGVNQSAGLLAKIGYTIDGQSYSYNKKSNVTKITSEVFIKSAAYYYSSQGDQLGIGPLPPMVDIPTTYLIVWSIDNRGNGLSGSTMTATLPAGVSWNDNKSLLSGNLYYLTSTRQVVWHIDKIAAENSENKARFEVSVTPGIKDVGKVVDLVTNSRFEAIDDYCQSEIRLSADSLTTNLLFDSRSAGKGKVVAQ